MLKRLRTAGITILVSTPYMDEASLCDRVALMQNGRVMTISTPREVIRNYPLSLLSVKGGDIYHLLGELRNYPGVHSVYAFGQSAHVAFSAQNIVPGTLFEFLKKNNHESVEIQPVEATIEDCFMELMNTPQGQTKTPL
jgi:ABC-2 type transport system ATP-binding protein